MSDEQESDRPQASADAGTPTDPEEPPPDLIELGEAQAEAEEAELAASRPRRRKLRVALRVVGYALMIGFAAAAIISAARLLTTGGPLVRPKDRPPAGEGAPTATAPARKLPNQELRIAVLADIGLTETGVSTLQKATAQYPDLYLALGDLSYQGAGSERTFCAIVRGTVGAVAPFEVVSGNHEQDGESGAEFMKFAECLPDRLGAKGEYGRQYYFDLGTLARFVVISPDLTIAGNHYYYGDDNENIRWVEAAIDGARKAGIQFVVVGMHKSCISVGEYYCRGYQDLLSLLVEKRVDLVLAGHEHSYQRSKQIAAPIPGCAEVTVDGFDADCVTDDGADDAYEQGAGSVFVVNGAAGRDLYNVYDADPEAGYFAATMGRNKDPRHGFVLLTVAKSQLHVRFVGTAKGDFSDAFTIRAAKTAAPTTTAAGSTTTTPTTRATPDPSTPATSGSGTPTAPSATAQVAGP